MGSDKNIGNQFTQERGASRTAMGFSGEHIISNVQGMVTDYSLTGRQTADRGVAHSDGINYVVKYTSEAFWRMDREFKFTYANAACEKLSGGFKLGELIGKSLLEFLAPESIEQFQRVNGERRNDEKHGIKTDVVYHELQMVRKDGTYFWVGISACPLRDIQGNIVGYQGISKDVSAFRRYETENRRLEGLLKKNEKLAALGRMTGVVAHEMNNVMAGILGFAELMIMQNDPDNETGAEHLENIVGFSERITAILLDIMVLSRKDDDVRKSVNLNDLIPALLQKCELSKFIARSGGVSVSLDLEPSLHDILASPASLEKALLNLLNVSFLQAVPGGFVLISTKTVYLGGQGNGQDNIREGEYVVLSVSDTGDGIAEEDTFHVFEPFYIRKIMNKKMSGMELTLAREIVKEHNGFIDIRSKVGGGSTFTVYLPVLSGKMQAPRSVMPHQTDCPEGQNGVH